MQTYRFYSMPEAGPSSPCRLLILESNDKAIALAQTMADKLRIDVEVWSDHALIGRMNARLNALEPRSALVDKVLV